MKHTLGWFDWNSGKNDRCVAAFWRRAAWCVWNADAGCMCWTSLVAP